MRFLWQSNAPWVGTGYGAQTKLMLKGLLENGHEPNMFAFYGLSGGVIQYDGYDVYPNSDYEVWGNDVVKAHIERSKSELIVTLIDVWVLNLSVWSKMKVPWAGWVPIDCDEIGKETIARLQLMDYPIAMSHFGAQMMMDAGIEPADVIYHAVDTEIFKPMDKQECRRGFGIGEKEYIIGMVMANKGDRKQYPNQLTAIKEWMDTRPDEDIKVFIHTDPTSSMAGWNLKEVVAKVGLTGKVYSTAQYDAVVNHLPTETMARIYNTFDVLMNCSSGEGFGIPIIEAQACGVPVITHGVTAMPEITHNGYIVKSSARGLAGHYGWQYVPDVEDMVYRLESVYRMCTRFSAATGRSWVEQNCGLPVIVDKWHRLFERIQADQEKKGLPIQIEVDSHPEGPLSEQVILARAAMSAESHAYGDYSMRRPEYELVMDELKRMGIRNGDRVLDVGAAFGDLGRFMQVAANWRGTYVPVDMVIDGTDIKDWESFPSGYNYIVLEQVVEHIEEWRDVVKKAEAVTGGIVIVTPNGEIVEHEDKHDFHGQMAHVDWVSPQEFIDMGYRVTTYSLTGQPRDTIIASKICNVTKDEDVRHSALEEISK